MAGVQLYADYAGTHRWFGAPGSDHHGDARLHASLAHLYGRPRTWIEAFHSSGWGGTVEETLDWLLPWLRAGATLYNPHAVYYTTRRGWWEWAPPSTDWRQPYWRHHRVFADAVTRLCAVLSQGRHACDVAVLLPTATAQAGTGTGHVDAAAARADEVYREIVGDMAWFATRPGVLDRLGLDADVIDEDSVRRATVADGRLTVSTEAYRAIILPAVTELDQDVATRLADFAAAGGLLITVGDPPQSLLDAHPARPAAASAGSRDLSSGTGAAPAATPAGFKDVSSGTGTAAPAATPAGSQDVSSGTGAAPAAASAGSQDVSSGTGTAAPAVTPAGFEDVSSGTGAAPAAASAGSQDVSSGTGADGSARSWGLFSDVGGVRRVATPTGLGEALAELPRRVEAPVPALVRETGDATLVFLTAAHPMASRISVG
ncbi:hypothetical protein ACFSTC_13140 [Nonomuraea ferruginea]